MFHIIHKKENQNWTVCWKLITFKLKESHLVNILVSSLMRTLHGPSILLELYPKLLDLLVYFTNYVIFFLDLSWKQFIFQWSILTCCMESELYANTCMTYMEPLIKANNKLLGIIQNKHSRSHTNDLYLNFNTLPIPLLFKFHIYKFLHRFNYFRSSLPSIYQNYFTFNTFFHHHFTRRQLDLHKFSTSTSIGKRQINIHWCDIMERT